MAFSRRKTTGLRVEIDDRILRQNRIEMNQSERPLSDHSVRSQLAQSASTGHVDEPLSTCIRRQLRVVVFLLFVDR